MSAPLILGLMTLPVPFLRLPRRAGRVFADGGRLRRRRVHRRHVSGHRPEDIRRDGFRGAAGDSVLPAGRGADELGQRRQPDHQPVARAGRTHPRRPVAGRHRVQHVLLGDVRLDHGRRRGDQPRAGRPDEKGGLQARLHRGHHRIGIDDRGAGAAEHHRGRLRRRRQRLDRRPVHGRRRAGLHDRIRADDLLLLLRARRHAASARAVSATLRTPSRTRRCR